MGYAVGSTGNDYVDILYFLSESVEFGWTDSKGTHVNVINEWVSAP